MKIEIKIFTKKRFEEVWGELESQRNFQDKITQKIFETNSSFHLKSAQRKKFNLCFSKVFC